MSICIAQKLASVSYEVGCLSLPTPPVPKLILLMASLSLSGGSNIGAGLGELAGSPS